MLDVSEQESNSSLSFEECNALRYVAGYVSRKIKEKLESSSDDRKNDLVLSLMEITMGDEEDEDIGTESWTNRIDRGGLWHVNDSLYCFFYLLEETIRKHLLLENLGKQAPGSRQALKETILHHEDVQFQWAVVSSSIDEDVSDILKHRFIELYITIRGFAYASSCLEFYKQQCKSNLQKKKKHSGKVSVPLLRTSIRVSMYVPICITCTCNRHLKMSISCMTVMLVCI